MAGDALRITPRFDFSGPCVRIAEYADGVEFQFPVESASPEDSARVPAAPSVRHGGLRPDDVRDFRHEITTVLCRAPVDAVLTCLRDLDVLDEPLGPASASLPTWPCWCSTAASSAGV